MGEARLAVLDIDGTVTDTIPLHRAAWERAGRSQPSEADHRMFAERSRIRRKA